VRMKPKRPAKTKALAPAKPGFDGLLRDLREFIAKGRRQVLRAVYVVKFYFKLCRENRRFQCARR